MTGVQAQWFGASATLPAGVNAEGGVAWNLEDTQTGTTPIQIPASPAVNYSYLKALQLAVIATSTATISNRTIRMASALAAGLGWHWKTDTQANWGATFNQQGGSKAPANTTGANSAATPPAGYTALTTLPVQYDNTAQPASSTGIDSALLLAVVLATDAGNAASTGAYTLPSLIFGYDDA